MSEAARCLAHFKREGLRVWCMLDADHNGPHRVWQGDLDAGASAWAIQWNETAAERRAG